MGVGVAVFGESSARGMELVTRSEARGRGVVSLRGGTGDGDVDLDLEVEGDGEGDG